MNNNQPAVPELSGKSLTLFPLVETDFQDYYELFTCSSTMKFVVGQYSPAEIIENFSLVLKSSFEVYFSVYVNEKHRKVGYVGASLLKSDKGTAELGIILRAKSFSKGAGREAAIVLINYLFSQHDIDKVKFTMAKDNKAAIRACSSIQVDFNNFNPNDDFIVGYVYKNSWQYF